MRWPGAGRTVAPWWRDRGPRGSAWALRRPLPEALRFQRWTVTSAGGRLADRATQHHGPSDQAQRHGGANSTDGRAAPGRHSARRRHSARHRLSTPPPERAATMAHMASLAAAFAFWAWLDRGLWFFGDEWNFLVGRGLSYAPTNPQSIWYPHNEHWSTLPVLLWRGLYSVFHLGTYWPYIIPVLLAQVLVMHLAWRVSLRAGADIWVATAAVAVLGFLGAGAEDLAWGFQVGFVGSVLFGLLAFDLLDRRPRPGWPQLVLASVSLVASLMCSTIGDAMVVGAAVLAFARLPWRRALAVLALPIFSYVLWFSSVGRLGLSAHSDRFTLGTLTALPRYMWDGLSWALGRASNLQPAGVVILVVLIVWAIWNGPKCGASNRFCWLCA